MVCALFQFALLVIEVIKLASAVAGSAHCATRRRGCSEKLSQVDDL